MSTPLRESLVGRPGQQALRVALIYFIVASVWFLLSDYWRLWPLSDPEERMRWDVVQDMIFGMLTSVSLYLLLVNVFRKNLSEVQNREKAEAARLEFERRYHFVFSAGTDAVLLVDCESNRVVDANAAAEAMYGYSHDEFLRLSALDLSAEPEKTKTAFAEIERHIPKRMHRRKNGVAFPVEISCSEFTYQNRKMHVAAMRDITDRQLAEEKLRESEERYRRLFELESDAIFLEDATTGFITDLNRSAERLYGYHRSEFFHLRLEDLTEVPGSLRVPVGSGFLAIPLDWHRKKGGERFPVEFTLSEFQHQGRPMRMGVVRDISVRQRAFERLCVASRELLDAQQIAGLGSYNFDVKSGLWTSTEVLDRLFGITEPGFVRDRQGWLRVVHPEDRSELARYFEEEVLAQGHGFDRRYRIVRLDDRAERWVHGLGKLVRNDLGEILQMTGTIQDITESKQREDQLRKLSRALEQSPAAVLITDVQGRTEYVNGAFTAITGYAREDIIGRDPIFLRAGKTPNETYERMRATVALGRTWKGELHTRRKNGEYFYEWATISPLLDAEGRVTHYIEIREDITERRQMESVLQLRERQFSSFFSGATAGLALHDRDLRFIRVNEALARMTGFPREAHLGRTVQEVIPELADQIEPYLQRVLASGEPMLDLELAGESHEQPGTVTYWSRSFFPILGNDNQVDGIGAIILDITARKQAEHALRESEEFKQAILNSVDAHIAVLDRHGVIRATNGPWQDFARENSNNPGNPASRTGVGTNYLEICQCSRGREAEDARIAFSGIQDVLEQRKTSFQHEYRCDSPMAERWFSMRVTPMGNSGQFVVVTHADITERQQKTNELRWKTALLEAQVESSLDGILVVDSGLRKLVQNQRLDELLQIPPEITANPDEKAQLEFITNQVRNSESFLEKVAYLYSHPEAVGRDEIELKNGMILDRYSSPVRDRTGVLYGRIWTFRDITKSRRLEAQLRQAQKLEAVGTLAGGIAHDFNNMLAVIFSYAALLQQDTEGSPDAQESIAEILSAGQRAKELVQQILTFSRQREPKRQALNLAPTLRDVLKFLRASIHAGVRIEAELAEASPTVLADPTQIHQIVMTLANNSVHAMGGESGLLTVRLDTCAPDLAFLSAHPGSRDLPYARLTLTDTGHGMDARTLERIFEPFFTTKPVGQGTGVGLAAVHGIMQAHEGIIEVKSQPGVGTTFELYFPTHLEEPKIAANSRLAMPRARQGERILLVDDECALANSFRKLLQNLNYEVVVQNSPTLALQLFQSNPHRFDLVITDFSMPEVDGLSLSEQLHKQRADLPIILMSGVSACVAEERLQQAGIHLVLAKPVSAPELAEAVERAIVEGRPQSHENL